MPKYNTDRGVCEMCGADATGTDVVRWRRIETCDACHDELQAEADADAAMDDRAEDCEVVR